MVQVLKIFIYILFPKENVSMVYHYYLNHKQASRLENNSNTDGRWYYLYGLMRKQAQKR